VRLVSTRCARRNTPSGAAPKRAFSWPARVLQGRSQGTVPTRAHAFTRTPTSAHLEVPKKPRRTAPRSNRACCSADGAAGPMQTQVQTGADDGIWPAAPANHKPSHGHAAWLRLHADLKAPREGGSMRPHGRERAMASCARAQSPGTSAAFYALGSVVWPFCTGRKSLNSGGSSSSL